MARIRSTITRSQKAAPPDLRRRSLLALGVPALGAAGLAAGLLRGEESAVAADSRPSSAGPAEDAGTVTPHREAYYRRARF